MISWIRFDKIFSFIVLVGLGLGTGLLIGSMDAESSPASAGNGAPTTAVAAEPTVWTCSMHPQVQMPKAGQCPLCGMDLIPLESGPGGDDQPRRLEMTESSRALAEIASTPVVRRQPEMVISMVGKVAFDETRQAHITSWVNGRIDRMYVDYTGIAVKKGDHLVSIYSPQLVTAQKEFTQAMKVVEKLGSTASEFMRESGRSTVVAAEEKLRLLGLTPAQIDSFKNSGTVQDHVTTYAPIAGVVVDKSVQEGMYVKEGTRVYSIVDLTHVWILLDAYEMDLSWLRYGQRVTFEAQAFPGRMFEGRISFIQPTLDEATRTIKVRVNANNPDGTLKPGMFVRGKVKGMMASAGQVMDPSLEGKWISPMHPEVVRDQPGPCPVCGMALVSAESLGFVPGAPDEAPLVIPATAPLITGNRSVVYVEVPGMDNPTYEGRTVTLGARAGDFYIVVSGVAEGERVVTSGNFKIDSALQIQAHPSMMTPASPDHPGHTDTDHSDGSNPMAGSHHGPAVDSPGTAEPKAGSHHAPAVDSPGTADPMAGSHHGLKGDDPGQTPTSPSVIDLRRSPLERRQASDSGSPDSQPGATIALASPPPANTSADAGSDHSGSHSTEGGDQ